MNSLVVVKFVADTRSVSVDFTQELNGETIVSATTGASDPVGLTVTQGTPTLTAVPLSVGPGTDGQSYGVLVNVTTNTARVISKLVAVVINEQMAYDFQNVNLDAFQALVGEIEVGQAAIGNVAFMFPLDSSVSNGQIVWELIDQDGRIYSQGNAFGLTTSVLSHAVKVTASAVINVPSDVTPTLEGQAYQVRWTLRVNGQTYYSYETLRVTSSYTVPVGPEDIIELSGDDFPAQLVFSKPFENVSFAVYYQNDKITGDIPANQSARTSDGWLYTGMLQGVVLPAHLEPYSIMWTGYNSNAPAARERQTGKVFIVNASIMSAVSDLRLMINKAHTTLFHEQDMIFSEAVLLSFLVSGRDYFNGAGAGMLTAFTMLNAQGSIREFWIRSSAVAALRAQYLAEGEKAFNFSGKAISLDVDRSQFYQSLLDNLKSELDTELKPFKQNLIKKGINTGDGNMDPSLGLGMRRGANGSVGITISPATGWSKWGARSGIMR